jgi:ribosome-binding protein aMBF1 (putative translation factor)
MSLQDLKKELFKNKKFKKYFEQHRTSYEISVAIMSARISKGISQAELAKKIGTKQPSIARLERGSYLPSLRFLKKIEEALRVKLFSINSLKDTNKSDLIELKSELIIPYSPIENGYSVSYLSDASGKKYNFLNNNQ